MTHIPAEEIIMGGIIPSIHHACQGSESQLLHRHQVSNLVSSRHSLSLRKLCTKPSLLMRAKEQCLEENYPHLLLPQQMQVYK